MTPGPTDRRRPLLCAAVAVALAFAWQGLIVRYNYSGNWTSYFYTGDKLAQPPSLASEHIYLFPGTDGYDGQFYHYIAHDPLFRHDLYQFIDAPRLRYRRILLPALAVLVAAGQPPAIDAALVAVNLAFLFAGVYWSCRLLAHYGRQPAWGLLFLLVPAVLVSFDRLTVDLALTALCMGFALYVTEGQSWKVYLILLLAPLTRETGALLIVAYCLTQLLDRRVSRAFLFATSAVPACAWYVFVQRHTDPFGMDSWFTPIPLAGVFERMIHPTRYTFTALINRTAGILDECALAGIVLAVVLSFWPPPAKYPRPLLLAAALMALSALNLGTPFWLDAFAFGRIFSPMLVLIALRTCATRSWIPLLPVALIAPRIALQVAYQLVRVSQAFH